MKGEYLMKRKRSQSSRRSQTPGGQSQKLSRQQQGQPGSQEATLNLLDDSSMLSEEQLQKAISIASQLAMLDALSMIRRKAAQGRLKQNQLLRDSKSQTA